MLARSSPDDKFKLVTRLNGIKLPKTQEEWTLMHPGKDFATQSSLILPGMRGEWNVARG